MTRPTLATLTPALARAPEELTAANVVSGWTESVSLAPAVAGLLLAQWGPGWVFLVMSLLLLVAAAIVLPVRGPPAAKGTSGEVTAELLEGFEVLRREPAARLLVGMLGSQYVAIGSSTCSTSSSRSTRSAWATAAPAI